MQPFGLATALLLLRLVYTVEVTPNSECSSLCDNNISNGADPGADSSSWTLPNDVVCNDYELDGPNQTVVGRKFKDCLTCELNSTATDSKTNQNEVYWVLFNLKFTFDWCVFAFPDNSNLTAAFLQCGDICSGPGSNAKIALTDRLLQTNATIQYQYCKDGDGAFSKVADDCAKCLEQVPNSKAMANYVNALKAGCDQTPGPGELLKLNFDLFPPVSGPASATLSAGTVTVTANPVYPPPSSPADLAAASASSAARSAASASVVASTKKKHDDNVRVGVGVGVGVGGVAAILAVVGIIFWRHRSVRNREKFEVEARARWEAEYQGGQGPPFQQDDKLRPMELGELGEQETPFFVAEADDGRPRAPELASPDNTSRSTSKTLRNSNYGISRLMGKPNVPEKDDQRGAAR